MPPEPATPQEGLFGAFRQPPERRFRPRYMLGALLTALLVAGLVLWSGRNEVQVVTRHGLRSIRVGMTLAEVAGVLGPPLTPAPAPQGQECMRYGMLSWKAFFTLYSVCYEAGKLKSVDQKHYAVWKVKRDGSMVPFADPPKPIRPMAF